MLEKSKQKHFPFLVEENLDHLRTEDPDVSLEGKGKKKKRRKSKKFASV